MAFKIEFPKNKNINKPYRKPEPRTQDPETNININIKKIIKGK